MWLATSSAAIPHARVCEGRGATDYGDPTLARSWKRRTQPRANLRSHRGLSYSESKSEEEVLARVRAVFADWRGMLRAHAPEVRPRLRSLIQGRITTFMPKVDASGRRYEFSELGGRGTLQPILAGNLASNLASPMGFAIIQPGSLSGTLWLGERWSRAPAGGPPDRS